jgi:hypothetical protein
MILNPIPERQSWVRDFVIRLEESPLEPTVQVESWDVLILCDPEDLNFAEKQGKRFKAQVQSAALYSNNHDFTHLIVLLPRSPKGVFRLHAMIERLYYVVQGLLRLVFILNVLI